MLAQQRYRFASRAFYVPSAPTVHTLDLLNVSPVLATLHRFFLVCRIFRRANIAYSGCLGGSSAYSACTVCDPGACHGHGSCAVVANTFDIACSCQLFVLKL